MDPCPGPVPWSITAVLKVEATTSPSPSAHGGGLAVPFSLPGFRPCVCVFAPPVERRGPIWGRDSPGTKGC